MLHALHTALHVRKLIENWSLLKKCTVSLSVEGHVMKGAITLKFSCSFALALNAFRIRLKHKNHQKIAFALLAH